MKREPVHTETLRQVDELSSALERQEREIADLRAQGERLAALVARAEIGIAVVQDGRIELANERLSALTGRASAALRAFAFDSFVHPDERKRVLDTLRRVAASRAAEGSMRFRLQPLSGETRVVDATLAHIDWTDGPAVMVSLRDVTERSRQEDESRRNRRLEVIGTLAGGIAHDFNNILGTITGYTELARLESTNGGTRKEHLAKVLKAARRAHALVERILTISQRAETVMQPLHLDALVRRADVLIRAAMPTNIDLCLELAERDTAVIADATQLEQVLLNLVTNARHAMQETGGDLLISVAPVTISGDEVEADPGLTPGDYVRLRVGDTGLGMDEHTLRRIFEPYFTTKPHGQGTGLGLAVTQGIVEGHGGRVRVSSRLGEGSLFDVYLPRVPLGSALLETPADMKIYPGSERILLVDDEASLVELGEQLLSQFGYRVQGCTSGAEALERFRDDPAAFDLVVTDQHMPELRGDQLAERLLALRDDLPIILVTGYRDRIDRARARTLGFKGYLTKPVEVSELTRVIRISLGDDLR